MENKTYPPLQTGRATNTAQKSISRKKIFKKQVYTCPMALLNACISDLAKQDFEIKKVAIFEDPPQAILHIKKTKLVKSRTPWLHKLRGLRTTNAALTCVKLYVTKTHDSRTPLHLNYEIMSSEVL